MMWLTVFLSSCFLTSAEHDQARKLCDRLECSRDSDAMSLVQSLNQRASRAKSIPADQAFFGTELDDSTACKNHDVPCPGFQGCPNPDQCTGVVVQPPLDPASPFVNVTSSSLASKVAQVIVETAVGALTGGASEFFFALASVFWPSASTAPSATTMWDTMVNWVENYVQQEITQQEVRNLQDTLNGLQEAFREASLFEPCGETQLSKMNDLDDQMIVLSKQFQDTAIDWQGMALFPTFVDLHLAIKSYLFRAVNQHDAGVILELTNTTLLGPKGYADTAKQFHGLIVANRLAKIPALTITNSGYDSSIACNFNEVSGTDDWDTTCGWTLSAPVQGVIQCVAPSGMEYECDHSTCSDLEAQYQACRDDHVGAVQSAWFEFFSNFLLLPAQVWPKLVQVMERDFTAGNQTFADCNKDLMPSVQQLEYYVNKARAKTLHRYG